jgi:hypothetical protein
VSDAAKEKGFTCPVFLTQALWQFVHHPAGEWANTPAQLHRRLLRVLGAVSLQADHAQGDSFDLDVVLLPDNSTDLVILVPITAMVHDGNTLFVTVDVRKKW